MYAYVTTDVSASVPPPQFSMSDRIRRGEPEKL